MRTGPWPRRALGRNPNADLRPHAPDRPRHWAPNPASRAGATETERALQPLSTLLLQLTQANAASLGSLVATMPDHATAADRTDLLQRVTADIRRGMDGAITTASHCVTYLINRCALCRPLPAGRTAYTART